MDLAKPAEGLVPDWMTNSAYGLPLMIPDKDAGSQLLYDYPQGLPDYRTVARILLVCLQFLRREPRDSHPTAVRDASSNLLALRPWRITTVFSKTYFRINSK